MLTVIEHFQFNRRWHLSILATYSHVIHLIMKRFNFSELWFEIYGTLTEND